MPQSMPPPPPPSLTHPALTHAASERAEVSAVPASLGLSPGRAPFSKRRTRTRTHTPSPTRWGKQGGKKAVASRWRLLRVSRRPSHRLLESSANRTPTGNARLTAGATASPTNPRASAPERPRRKLGRSLVENYKERRRVGRGVVGGIKEKQEW